MLILFSLDERMFMGTVSNALLRSSAVTMVRVGGFRLLNPVSM